MKWRPGRGTVLVARALVSILMLTFLARRVHLASLFPRWGWHSAAWLTAGLVVTALSVWLAAWRWSRVLHALGVRHTFMRILSNYLAGLFVGNFLPSTIGGDYIRMRRLAATSQDASGTFASVVLERLTGWLVLPVISFAALAVNPGLREFGRSGTAAAVALLTVIALVAILVAAGSKRIGGKVAGHENWLRFLGAVHLGVDRLRRAPMASLEVAVAAFAYQTTVVAAAWLAAKGLGVNLSPTAALAYIPIVAIVQVLPISLGGLGVREGAIAYFLHPLGVPEGRAIALGVLLYGMNLAVSLGGAPAFAIGGKNGGRKEAERPGAAKAVA